MTNFDVQEKSIALQWFEDESDYTLSSLGEIDENTAVYEPGQDTPVMSVGILQQVRTLNVKSNQKS